MTSNHDALISRVEAMHRRAAQYGEGDPNLSFELADEFQAINAHADTHIEHLRAESDARHLRIVVLQQEIVQLKDALGIEPACNCDGGPQGEGCMSIPHAESCPRFGRTP